MQGRSCCPVLKILISTFSFPPNKDGVSEAAAASAKAFLARGWEVDVATEPTVPARTSQEWHGAQIREFSITGTSYFRHPYVGQTTDYRDFLRSGNWDVIIFHAYSWPVYIAADWLPSISAKKILVSHGYSALVWTPVRGFPFGLAVLAFSAIQSLLMLGWVRGIDRWVFLSRQKDFGAFYDRLLAEISRHPGIITIPNGVEVQAPPQRIGSFRKAMGIPEQAPLFVCIANYSLRKAQGFAAASFRLARINNSYLVFIGSEFNDSSSVYMAADASAAKSNTPGKIFWLEKLSRVETLQALADSDVCVLSANFEAQPIVLLEAMAFSKPWIARQAGCIRELPGGFCVKNQKAMSEAMRQLAQDPDLRQKLGKEGRKAIEAKYQRKKYEELYCRLVEEVVQEGGPM